MQRTDLLVARSQFLGKLLQLFPRFLDRRYLGRIVVVDFERGEIAWESHALNLLVERRRDHMRSGRVSKLLERLAGRPSGVAADQRIEQVQGQTPLSTPKVLASLIRLAPALLAGGVAGFAQPQAKLRQPAIGARLS